MKKHTIAAGGLRRTYHHVAPSTPRANAPLIVALHGTGQQGPTMRRFSGRTLDRLADSIGADLVYLDGYKRTWNDGRVAKTNAAGKAGIDDTSFIAAVIERFARPAVVVGFSNGGQMAHRIVRERPDLFTGVVSIAAGLPVDEDYTLDSTLAAPVRALILHGDADPIVPEGGGEVRLFGKSHGFVRSARQTAQAYAEGHAPVATMHRDADRYDWDGVRLVVQKGAGHVIPNRTHAPMRFPIGPSQRTIDTGEEIMNHFNLGVQVVPRSATR